MNNQIELQYESYWKLNQEEKEKLMSDYGVLRTTAMYDRDTGTLKTNPIDSRTLDFSISEYVASFVIYKDQYYPTYLKEYDTNEYVDIQIDEEDLANG